jgi:5-enolpyruvylshikimate-3-phosphate synthase
MGIVVNVHEFIAAALLQLRARLKGKDFLAERGPLRELVDYLEQVGVEVRVESAQSGDLQPKYGGV